MENYELVVKPGELSDIGNAIRQLIENVVKTNGGAFLVQVTAVNGNKVNIKKIINKQGEPVLEINNCLIGFPSTKAFFMQFKVNVGDIGLAIVVNEDISNFKLTGEPTTPLTNRYKNANDSIYIPLSLFDTLTNENVEMLISARDGSAKLEFKDTNAILQANLIAIKSQNTTLKVALNNLATILTNAQIKQTPSGVQPFDGGTISQFNNWKSALDNLFLE